MRCLGCFLALILCIGVSLNPAVYFFLAEIGQAYGIGEGKLAFLNKRSVVCQRRFLATFFYSFFYPLLMSLFYSVSV